MKQLIRITLISFCLAGSISSAAADLIEVKFCGQKRVSWGNLPGTLHYWSIEDRRWIELAHPNGQAHSISDNTGGSELPISVLYRVMGDGFASDAAWMPAFACPEDLQQEVDERFPEKIVEVTNYDDEPVVSFNADSGPNMQPEPTVIQYNVYKAVQAYHSFPEGEAPEMYRPRHVDKMENATFRDYLHYNVYVSFTKEKHGGEYDLSGTAFEGKFSKSTATSH